eukprot:Hpha_TRINITY_DN33639_c0_g1::TRINITY_DN33639_c0_g1_i1::g.43347::m.43347
MWCFVRLDTDGGDDWSLGKAEPRTGGGSDVTVRLQQPGGEEDSGAVVLCTEADCVPVADNAAMTLRSPRDDLLFLPVSHEAAALTWLRARFSQGLMETWLGGVLLSFPTSDQAPAPAAQPPGAWSPSIEGLAAENIVESGLGYANTAFVPLGRVGAYPLTNRYLADAQERCASVELRTRLEAARILLSTFTTSRGAVGAFQATPAALVEWKLGVEASKVVSAEATVGVVDFGAICGEVTGRVMRCFHALISGPDAERYLLRGGRAAFQGVFGSSTVLPGGAQKDDSALYAESSAAMTLLGLKPEHVWRAVAGIAHLCEVGFEPGGSSSPRGSPSSPRSVASLRLAAGLLGLDVDRFRAAVAPTGCSAAVSTAQRNAAARWCYAAMLRHIVDTMNASLKQAALNAQPRGSVSVLAVPDKCDNGLWGMLTAAIHTALESRFVAGQYDVPRLRERAERASGSRRLIAAARGFDPLDGAHRAAGG